MEQETLRQKQTKSWKKRNPDKVKEHTRRGNLKSRFGITVEEYTSMFNSQQGCCSICNKHQSDFRRNFAVDHCHITGKVRGLLCVNCNTAIGKLNDNPELLRSALSYLEKYNG